MKKLIALLIALTMCVLAFTACGASKDLSAAKDYLSSMYKDDAVATPSDYTRVGKISISGVSYNVEWSVSVSSGSAEGVKIVAGDDGKVTVDVNEKTEEEIVYTLTAKISDAKNKSINVSFDHKVPIFKELTWSEYVAAAEDDTVVVKGIVTAIMAKSKGNTYNCLYLQDDDGAYYVYNFASDPVTDDKIELGMTVRVSGSRATYNGTYEIMNAAVEIIDESKKTVTPADYTGKFTAAASLKDASLVENQSSLVTLKNVEITGEDTKNGYYKFRLGSLESYVRISSSVCPLTKTEQSAFASAHAAHLGWTANVTGIICLYDGAFYLTPVSEDAFEYVGLPAKDDAGMVAFEKENAVITGAVTEDTEITLNTAGKGYTQVSVTWASDNACAVVTDGKLTITLPEAETTVKLTATFKSGEVTDTKVFEIVVDAAPSDVYVAKAVDSPVKDTAYKYAIEQVNLGKMLYLTGKMNGNYFATTDKADKAVDVYLEEVEGGLRLYFLDGEVKTYFEIYEYTEGKVGVHLTTEPKTVYTFNTELHILVANVLGADYYLGTYKTYDTASASKTKYITGENADSVGVSQFVARLVTLAPAKYSASAVDSPVKDTAYKYAIEQVNLGKTLYLTGKMNGNYFATTDKAEKAADVYLEEVEGGLRLYFLDGEVKTYFEIYEYTEGKVGVHLTTEPKTVYTFNTELHILVANVLGADYYLGTYKTYDTASASKTKYITGENADSVGVSQFVARLVTISKTEVRANAAEAPVKDTAYKYAIEQVNLGKMLYLTGKMNGNYFATTDKLSKAADVYLEEVEGGLRLYFLDGEVKTYFEIYEYTEGKVGVHLTTEPKTVYTFNTELHILTANILGADYYLGTYKTYDTASASKTKYITGENADSVGVSQFVARLVTIDPIK